MKKIAFLTALFMLLSCIAPLFLTSAAAGPENDAGSGEDPQAEGADAQKSPVSIVFTVIFALAAACAVMFFRRRKKRY